MSAGFTRGYMPRPRARPSGAAALAIKNKNLDKIPNICLFSSRPGLKRFAAEGFALHVAGGPGVVALWSGIMHRKAGQVQVVWSSLASMPARSVRRFFCLQPGKRQATEWPLFPERDPHAGKS